MGWLWTIEKSRFLEEAGIILLCHPTAKDESKREWVWSSYIPCKETTSPTWSPHHVSVISLLTGTEPLVKNHLSLYLIPQYCSIEERVASRCLVVSTLFPSIQLRTETSWTSPTQSHRYSSPNLSFITIQHNLRHLDPKVSINNSETTRGNSESEYKHVKLTLAIYLQMIEVAWVQDRHKRGSSSLLSGSTNRFITALLLIKTKFYFIWLLYSSIV